MKKGLYWVAALLLLNVNVFGQDMAYQEVKPLFEAIGVKADKSSIKIDLLHKYDKQNIFIEAQRASFDELLESEASFQKLYDFYLNYLSEAFTETEISELSTFFSDNLGQSVLEFGSEKDFFVVGNQWKASQNLKDKLTMDYIEELEVYFNEGVGQKFVQNFEKIYKEGEETFVHWEKAILKQAFDNVKYQWRDEFETDYDLDVDFREGKFERIVWKTVEGKKIEENKLFKHPRYLIERKDGIQINTFFDLVYKSKMVWLSNTRYRLYWQEKDGTYSEDNFVEFNIYAVEDGIIKYARKSGDMYSQGEMKVVE